MRRLTVGESSHRNGAGMYPSVKLYRSSAGNPSKGIKKDLREEKKKIPVENCCREDPPPRAGIAKSEGEHRCAPSRHQERMRKKNIPFSFGDLSPDKPLLRLGSRDVFAEDILLVLLIITLIQDEADTELIAALVYILLTP